jgi:hypothetical protein
MAKTNTTITKSIIDNLSKKKVSIRQYVDSDVSNLGLENHGMSVFFGENGSGGHKEWIGYKQIGNTRVYLTGLEKNSENITSLKSSEEKDAELKQLDEVKKYLESFYGEGVLDSTTRDFWNEIFIEVKTPVLELDLSDTKELILYYAIKGGGFSEIAPSYEYAKSSVKIYKFYLHEDLEVMSIKTELTKSRNRAKAKLQIMYDEEPKKMFYISKCILPITKGFRSNTVNDIIYQDLNDYIEGKTVKNNIKETATNFLKYAAKDLSELLHEAIVEEALYQRVITKNAENIFINNHTNEEYGRTKEDVSAFLKNPIHTEELLYISEKINGIWGK